MRRFLLAVTVTALCWLTAPALAAPRDPAAADPFRGTGAWVSIFDRVAWQRPERTVAALDRRGVQTLYLQTSSTAPGHAIFRPDRTARFLRAAHRRHLRVVAWSFPTYARPADELRRAVAAVRFRGSDGAGFDGFALDIEAVGSSPPVQLRNRRLLSLVRALRRAAGEAYPLGAIVPSPHGLTLAEGRRWWPSFPFQALHAHVDAFLPMTYWTYRGTTTARAVYETRRNVELLRAATRDPDVPVHVIGGLADRSNAAAGRAFVEAATASGAAGFSFYDLDDMGPEDWAALAGG